MAGMDDADGVLRGAVRVWAAGAASEGPAYERWSEPGGYTLRGGTLGFAGAEFVVWVAVAAGSGVVGNVAYDALRELVGAVRERHRAERVLGEAEAVFLARLAVRVTLIHEGLGADRDVEVLGVSWDGEWRVRARCGAHEFDLAVTDQAPEDAMVFGAHVG
ncbi:hypothetical protein Acsp01_80270 [Actinoplanes sp. NBRC 101535]|nr:hypothetical protein Acsp01_80270 [Actinoplanes sp. NBRC 101535]